MDDLPHVRVAKIHIYIYICVCVCVCVCIYMSNDIYK